MTKQIERLLKKHFAVEGTVTIHPDGTVDVTGDVKLKDSIKVTRLPVKFGEVRGEFDCMYNQLTSLEGAPESVDGDFYCTHNKLTSLVGVPKSVGGDFDCGYNQLKSLDGAPQTIGGEFVCVSNRLKSLEGAPKSVGGYFDCGGNKLTSLEGAPKSVGGSFYCSSNLLTSLEGAPKLVGGDFYCHNNPIISLEGAPESVGGEFYCNKKLTSLNGMPSVVKGKICLIYNMNLPLLKLITNQIGSIELTLAPKVVLAIITKYLNNPTRPGRYKAAMLCAKELTDAGYPGNAKL